MTQPPRAYREQILGLCREHGIPPPEFEVKFHPTRAWRFDVAWSSLKIAIEVQGGTWRAGRHSRGAGQHKDWEKINEAQALAWAILQFDPQDVLAGRFVELVRRLLYLRALGKPAE
jgi:hypothetical protein